MNKIPMNYIIMTSTKGHFDRHDIYKKTISDLNNKFPLRYFSERIAHIKVSEDSKQYAEEMITYFHSFDFKVLVSMGQWKHNNETHQKGYLQDLTTVFSDNFTNKTEFSLVSEDDFLISGSENLDKCFDKALQLLKNDSNFVQVRIPRFNNEYSRINKLQEKHGLNAWAEAYDETFFAANDWSNNIYITRTRDLYQATLLIERNKSLFGEHSEHSLGAAMKYLSRSATPLAIFKPDILRAFHIGTKSVEEEDQIGQILNSD